MNCMKFVCANFFVSVYIEILFFDYFVLFNLLIFSKIYSFANFQY